MLAQSHLPVTSLGLWALVSICEWAYVLSAHLWLQKMINTSHLNVRLMAAPWLLTVSCALLCPAVQPSRLLHSVPALGYLFFWVSSHRPDGWQVTLPLVPWQPGLGAHPECHCSLLSEVWEPPTVLYVSKPFLLQNRMWTITPNQEAILNWHPLAREKSVFSNSISLGV